MERRHLPQYVAAIKAEERAEGGRRLSGYAAVYYDGTPDTEFRIRADIVERIHTGAFDNLEEDIVALFNHSPDNVLGRTVAGTLLVRADDRGLRYEVELGDTQIARDVSEHVRRGDVRGSSFAFRVVDQDWTMADDGRTRIRNIRAVQVFDVGPVTSPAYSGTDVSVRSDDDAREALDALRSWELEREDRGSGPVTLKIEKRDLERRCATQLMGVWCADPRWIRRAIEAVRSGTYRMVEEGRATTERPGDGVPVDAEGIVTIEIVGEMTKRGSSFGGASAVAVRHMVREASERDDVRGILLVVDSPGGTFHGTTDLADEIFRARQLKPVVAYIEDLGASAAYFVASQAEKVYANRAAEVGSIGTYAVVHDLTEMAEKEGVRVHVVSTGERKGDFVPGTPVTEEALAELRVEVERANDIFLDAVRRGRGVDRKTVSTWATGQVWQGKEAQALGLIDGVTTIERARDVLLKSARARRTIGAR